MDENQSTDNDLQKAIDNINNNSDNSTEPTFSEPVAAPSTVPEGDSGELGEPVGPFPMPPALAGNEPNVNVVEPGPEPIAPIDPINIPDLGENGSASVTPAPDNNGNAPIVPGGDVATAPNAPETDNTTPNISTDHNTNLSDAEIGGDTSISGNLAGGSENHQIKEAALKALIPLLKDHVKASPEEKFELCKDIFENLHDSSVFDQAYQAASEITDEDARAQALLFIIESIE